MKKKTVVVMMAALMVAGMMSAVNVQAGIEDKTLIVGFDAEYPPYGYMDENGEYTGFDLELAQAVCELEGWELEKKPLNWDSKDMELNSGSIDCIWNGFTMNGREDEYTFSVPYVDNSQVIVVAEDSGIEKLTDLAGKTVQNSEVLFPGCPEVCRAIIPGTLPAKALDILEVGKRFKSPTFTLVTAPVTVSFFCAPIPVTTTSSSTLASDSFILTLTVCCSFTSTSTSSYPMYEKTNR